jgi:hypothetical protein
VVKPFNIQSPENIAKEYAGNKQRIAEAMQMGVVDPTAGVLAGMFIDRMRAGQMQEGMPQSTVAQQVMGGAPSAAPAPPLPAGGLGDTPQAAPSMTPEMGMGMPPEMGMAPQGQMPMMAEGGLATLPVPDAMFDEPTNGGFNDGYAGGGIVAFSRGGDVDLERLRRAILMQESGGDYGVMNREGSGAMGAYQFIPDTARALAKRAGLEYRPDLMSGKKGRSKEGIAYQERLMDEQMKDILAYSGGDVGRAGIYHFAGPNEKGHGPKTRQYEKDILRRYSGSKDSGEIPDRDLDTAEGRGQSFEDIYSQLQSRFGPDEKTREIDDRRMARAEEMASPEFYEKERKTSMWETLAEIGFNMASSKSPFLLQAVGEAAAAALPGAKVARKERQRLQDRALDVMSDMNGLRRKENRELLPIAMQAFRTGIDVDQFGKKLALDERQLELAERKFKAEIDAAERDGMDPEKLAVRYMLEYPAGSTQHEAAKNYYETRYGQSSRGASNAGTTSERVKGIIDQQGGEGSTRFKYLGVEG